MWAATAASEFREVGRSTPEDDRPEDDGAALLQRRKAEAALLSLNEGFRAALLRFFQRRTADHLEAEDMVQELFERLIRRGNVSDLANLKAYAFETAVSVLRDRARKQRTRHAHAHQPFDPEFHGGQEVSPEHILLSREQLRQAEGVLAALPKRTRTIFLLRRLNGLRHADIAQQLGISVSAVEKHMSRAATRLMEEFGATEEAPAAAPPSRVRR